MLLFLYANKHFSQLLICDKCGTVIELQDDALVTLLASNAEKHWLSIDESCHWIAWHLPILLLRRWWKNKIIEEHYARWICKPVLASLMNVLKTIHLDQPQNRELKDEIARGDVSGLIGMVGTQSRGSMSITLMKVSLEISGKTCSVNDQTASTKKWPIWWVKSLTW